MEDAATLAAPDANRSIRTGLEWLADFEREHGRPLRVLHFGNIANNAYNNAKIQRARGIDADVSCHDYYDAMGTPEWEDAVPAFSHVHADGFRRPRWFAQGRSATVERYLMAVREGRRSRAALQWLALRADRWLRGGRSRSARAVNLVFLPYHRRRLRMTEVAPSQATGSRRLSSARDGGVAGAEPARARELVARFADFFPERSDRLHTQDFARYRDAERWARLFAKYDIVQAYATDPIVPVVCRVPRFAAYEHGTLRAIPFEDSSRGRLCAIAYREAPVVFVTNSDVVPSAEALGISQDRLVFLPHAVDSERLLRFAKERQELGPRSDVVTFFSPSRQDWVDADPNWAKGNDRAIRALSLVRERGVPCRLLLSAWGRDLEASKSLVQELGLNDLIEWLPVLPKPELWDAYLTSHAVLDQFVLTAIGGVAFEAMALGRRVITALDVDAAASFFGASPPLIACSSPEEIAEAMTAVLEDPLDAAGLGQRAQDWFRRYHSADRIVELQAQAYRRLVGALSSGPP
jgi:glycosyltransferase involved in cell wall biosynthesis